MELPGNALSGSINKLVILVLSGTPTGFEASAPAVEIDW
jgi:hypothetical protein